MLGRAVQDDEGAANDITEDLVTDRAAHQPVPVQVVDRRPAAWTDAPVRLLGLYGVREFGGRLVEGLVHG